MECNHGEVQKEIERIVGRYYFARDNADSFDLESFELAIRTSMHGIGRRMLEMFVNADGGDYRGRTIPCENDHQYEFIEFRDKKLLTVLGPMTVTRAYYYDRECRSGYCPKDSALDIEGTSYSSGVRRMMSKVGAYRSFGLGHEDLYELADIRVSAKEVERISQTVGGQAEAFHAAEAAASLSDNIIPIKPVPQMYVCMDGTGVPVVKKETAGRTKINCISGQRNAARNWMMAGRKRSLMPSIAAHSCRDTIKRYVNGRPVILRRTRNGCGMRISGREVSL